MMRNRRVISPSSLILRQGTPTDRFYGFFAEKRREEKRLRDKRLKCTVAATTATAVTGLTATFTLASLLEQTVERTVSTNIPNPLAVPGIVFSNLSVSVPPYIPPTVVPEIAIQAVNISTTGAMGVVRQTFGWLPSASFSIVGAWGGCFTIVSTALTGLFTWMCCCKEPSSLEYLEQFSQELSHGESINTANDDQEEERYQRLEEGNYSQQASPSRP